MSTAQQRGIVVLEEAARMLSAAESLEEVQVVRNKAEAARTYARTAKLGMELQNLAAELKLRAERKAGEFLRGLALRGGDRRSKSRDATLKLEAFGVSKHQSAQWQLEAEVPETVFVAFLEETRHAGREITTAGLLRLAAHFRNQCRVTPSKPPQRGSSAKKCTAKPTGGPVAGPVELIAELRHHHSGLSMVIEPLFQGEGELGSKQRRIAKYLLGEITRVLDELSMLAE